MFIFDEQLFKSVMFTIVHNCDLKKTKNCDFFIKKNIANLAKISYNKLDID